MPPRWVVLTIPVVTVFWRENGLPIATTNSPGRNSAERPRRRTGSFLCKIWGKNQHKAIELQAWKQSLVDLDLVVSEPKPTVRKKANNFKLVNIKWMDGNGD